MKTFGFLLIVVTILIFGGLFLISTLTISNPKSEECTVLEIMVNDIREGTSSDIVFKDNGIDFYYINRGLERGLSVDSLRLLLLNKKVTLHLPKLWLGTSKHIAQLALGDDVIFTEFE